MLEYLVDMRYYNNCPFLVLAHYNNEHTGPELYIIQNLLETILKQAKHLILNNKSGSVYIHC